MEPRSVSRGRMDSTLDSNVPTYAFGKGRSDAYFSRHRWLQTVNSQRNVFDAQLGRLLDRSVHILNAAVFDADRVDTKIYRVMPAFRGGKSHTGKFLQLVFSLDHRGEVQKTGFVGDDLKFRFAQSKRVNDNSPKQQVPKADSQDKLFGSDGRGCGKAGVIGYAEFPGHETGSPQQVDFEAFKTDALAENLLEFLLDLLSMSPCDEIKSLHQGRSDHCQCQENNRQ